MAGLPGRKPWRKPWNCISSETLGPIRMDMTVFWKHQAFRGLHLRVIVNENNGSGEVEQLDGERNEGSGETTLADGHGAASETQPLLRD